MRLQVLVEVGGGRLGVRMRGGREHGVGVFVSVMSQDSVAKKCGLKVCMVQRGCGFEGRGLKVGVVLKDEV